MHGDFCMIGTKGGVKHYMCVGWRVVALPQRKPAVAVEKSILISCTGGNMYCAVAFVFRGAERITHGLVSQAVYVLLSGYFAWIAPFSLWSLSSRHVTGEGLHVARVTCIFLQPETLAGTRREEKPYGTRCRAESPQWLGMAGLRPR